MDDKSKEQARIRMKRMRERNKSVTSEQSVTYNDDVSFQGHKLKDLDPNKEFLIGSVWFKVKDLPYWLLDGELSRDTLRLASSPRMPAQTKRETFKDLMLQYDCRYGVRNQDHELIAMRAL